MAVPLTSQNFATFWTPFREIASGDTKGEVAHRRFLHRKTSDRNEEKYSSLTPMGKFTQFLGAIGYDGPELRVRCDRTHIEYALGMQIRRTLYDDDSSESSRSSSAVGRLRVQDPGGSCGGHLHGGVFRNQRLLHSHGKRGAVQQFPYTTVAGVSTGTGFDNLTTSELDPTSLTASIVQFRQFKDAAGICTTALRICS